MNFQIRCPCGKALHISCEDGITKEEALALRSRVHQHASGNFEHMTISWEDILTLPMESWSSDWLSTVPLVELSNRSTGISSPSGLSQTRSLTLTLLPSAAAASHSPASSQSDRLQRLEDSMSNIAQGLQHLGQQMLSSLQRSRSRSPPRGSNANKIGMSNRLSIS